MSRQHFIHIRLQFGRLAILCYCYGRSGYSTALLPSLLFSMFSVSWQAR
jgi:hypothetical protein